MKFPSYAFCMVMLISCTKSPVAENAAKETGSLANAVLLVKETAAAQQVTLGSNGYVYPQNATNGYGEIYDNTGLHNWTSKKGYTRTFVLFAATGKLHITINAKSPESNSVVNVKIGDTALNVTIPQAEEYKDIEVGNFNIKAKGYHPVTLTAVSKTGTYFPDVAYYMLSGEATAGLKYNKSDYRGAPSVHLWYNEPADKQIAWFYNEIKVPEGLTPLYAYYMTNGFNDGYFGIQVNSPTERRILFSIWSNYVTDNPGEIPEEYSVKLVTKAPQVTAQPFGGEGSGGQSFFNLNWKADKIYKLLVHAEASGTDTTIFTGYYQTPENKNWQLVAQWKKPKTQAKLLSGLYSFVENFSDNGNNTFGAQYGNQWIKTTTGEWMSLNKATITTTASEENHQRYDWGGGVKNKWFYMFTGGFARANVSAYGDEYTRPLSAVPPDIDNLPK